MKSRYGLEIRAAGPADAEGVAALLKQAGHGVTPVEISARLEAMRALPGAVLIAVEWGPPSGLVALHWFGALTEPRPVAMITALFVGPDDRRRGVGRLLLKAAAQAARVAGCDRLALAAGPLDDGLQPFCISNGLVVSGSTYTRNLRKAPK